MVHQDEPEEASEPLGIIYIYVRISGTSCARLLVACSSSVRSSESFSPSGNLGVNSYVRHVSCSHRHAFASDFRKIVGIVHKDLGET